MFSQCINYYDITIISLRSLSICHNYRNKGQINLINLHNGKPIILQLRTKNSSTNSLSLTRSLSPSLSLRYSIPRDKIMGNDTRTHAVKFEMCRDPLGRAQLQKTNFKWDHYIQHFHFYFSPSSRREGE